jgi:DNA-binding CsgD family transcriptional regulator
VLDFLQGIYAQQDVDSFAARVVESLPRLIPTDMASFNEVDPRTGRHRALVAPVGADRFPGSEKIFARHVREHPYIVHIGRFEDGRAHTVSELVSRAAFSRSAIYNEYYRRIGTEHQLAVALPGPAPWVRGIALSRGGRDFSERERRLLTALASHVVQAYRNAETLALARRAAGAVAVEVVLLSARGSVQFATPRARRWLAAYFGGSTARDGRLPSALADWVRARGAPLEHDGPVPPPWPLLVARDGARLEVQVAEYGQQALLIREHRRGLPAEPLAALELSPRETQVLAWVVEGKTNGEIGVILGARPRTVAKHLERIFRKLGVETRTAAAAAVLNCPAS